MVVCRPFMTTNGHSVVYLKWRTRNGKEPQNNPPNKKSREKEKKMVTKDQDEFAVVSEGTVEPEIKIVFDTIGDEFVGTYLGTRTMDNVDGKYIQYRFTHENETYFVNGNYSLREGMKNVRAGAKVRLRYVADIDTGQASPMRAFEVAVARRTSNVTTRATT